MPFSAYFTPNGDPHPLYSWPEAYVVYSPDDLDDVTRLTLDCYFMIPSTIVGTTGATPLIQSRGAPEDVGRRHLSVDVNDTGELVFTANATAGSIDAITAAGVISFDTPHHLMVVVDFTQTGSAKAKVYLDQTFVSWASYSQDVTPPTKFENYSGQSRYFFGWRVFSGEAVVEGLTIDYIRAWTGTAATADQASEYGGATRVNNGTLGTPTHLWDFEENLDDTGSSPFTIYYDQNITFVENTIHPPTPAGNPEVDMFPKTSDTEGGGQVVVHANISLMDETSDVDFRASRLPVGWTDSTSGTGTIAFRSGVTPLSGVRLSTRSTAGQVNVESGSDYGSFDAKMLVRCTTKDYSEASTVAHFSFNVEDVAQVRVTTDPLQSTSQFFVDGWIAGIQYAGFLTSTNDFELQIVRNSRWVFLLVNGIEIARSKRFSQDATGTLSFGVESTSQAVSSIFRKLEVRSHAIIGDRLIESKKNVSRYRISGLIPSAEVGTSDIMIFGPWGSATTSDPFVYTRPSALILGGGFVTY